MEGDYISASRVIHPLFFPRTHTHTETIAPNMTLITLPPTMKAVVWTGPNKVEVKQIPTPQIVDPTDVIIRTTTSGICGSDLHIYRGHLPVPEGYPIGHEVVGEIVQVGSDVRKWRAGDRVIAPFSASCGECAAAIPCGGSA